LVQVGSVIELVVKAHDKGLTDFEEAVKKTKAKTTTHPSLFSHEPVDGVR
jgi:hypothetical protein